MKSSILCYYILITGHSILLFMNPMNFVAVILKVLLVDLLAALNFAEPKKRAWRHGRAWKMKIRASIFTSIFMLFYINIPFKLIVSDALRIQ